MASLQSLAWLLPVVVAFRCVAADPEAAPTGAELVRKFQEDFDVEKASLSRPLDEVASHYRDALVRQKEADTKAGNTEGALAAMQALQSLATGLAESRSSNAAIEALRSEYRSQRDSKLQELAPRVQALLVDYTQKLKPFIESLVRQGFTDDALKVAERAEVLRQWMEKQPAGQAYRKEVLLCFLRKGAPALTGVTAWGRNDQGQIDVPPGLFGVTAVAAGQYHSLALLSDGTVAAWGGNDDGQAQVPEGLSGAIAIAAGEKHSLAVKSDGTVVAWGYNKEKQCQVPAGLTQVKAISSQCWHNIALKSDGTVVAWGPNGHGESKVPPGLSGVIQIRSGDIHNLALKADGTVVAWGSDDNGQVSVPDGLIDVVDIAAGHFHSLALTSNGTIVGWGLNDHGQLNIPRGLNHVCAIAAQGWHSAALTSEGKVVVWGFKQYGQNKVPKELGHATALATGTYHLLAIEPMRP